MEIKECVSKDDLVFNHCRRKLVVHHGVSLKSEPMLSIKSVCEVAMWLDQPLASVTHTRIGWLKKRALLRGSPLKREDVHNGPSIDWFGVLCPTMIGSVRGTIYKVAVTVVALRINPYTIVETISEEISNRLGAEGTETSQGLIIWHANDGNVVLQSIQGSVPSTVTIFLTSQIARTFI